MIPNYKREGRRLGPATLALAITLALAAPALAADGVIMGTVTEVLSGDSVGVEAGGVKGRVRLYGVVPPRSGQPYCLEAAEVLRSLLKAGDAVMLQLRGTDRLGWRQAWVTTAKGRPVNAVMVARGAVWVDDRHCLDEGPCEVMYRIQDEARAAHRGLWADEEAIAPWSWPLRKDRVE